MTNLFLFSACSFSISIFNCSYFSLVIGNRLITNNPITKAIAGKMNIRLRSPKTISGVTLSGSNTAQPTVLKTRLIVVITRIVDNLVIKALIPKYPPSLLVPIFNSSSSIIADRIISPYFL